MSLTLEELAGHVNGKVYGDGACEISHVATLQGAAQGAISFLSNRSYRKYLSDTKASAVILSEDDQQHCKTNCLVVKDPYVAFARISALLNPADSPEPGIHESASIDPDAVVHASACIDANATIKAGVSIKANAYIGPGCVLEKDVTIGDDCYLHANITLCKGVTLGERCLVHPGVVIGSDGFGIANDQGQWIKVPQVGSVVIGNDVEIGANTTIDRGALEDTVIEDGVKLDNQIQVAHNVRIGAHTAIAGCVGIAGSAVIGRHCAIGGGAVILGHLEIVDKVQITAMSLVTKSIPEAGVYSSGTPLQANDEWRKNFSRFRRLDDMARRLKRLEKKIKE
jgi:UDP-3-O-[3-hydroxymyristoyl] glucosamine N-acyltransferase